MEESPKALADELEQVADQLEERGEAVQKHIDETRNDWESKRADPSVPGAPPREDDDQAAAVESPIPDDVADPQDEAAQDG
jgi:hypothetical protein